MGMRPLRVRIEVVSMPKETVKRSPSSAGAKEWTEEKVTSMKEKPGVEKKSLFGDSAVMSTSQPMHSPLEWVLTVLARAVMVLQEQLGQPKALSAETVRNIDAPVEVASNDGTEKKGNTCSTDKVT